MKYSEKALATIKGKKFIIGMATAGMLAASMAAPSAAGALSVGGSGNSSSSNAGRSIALGTMASGNLQGSAWATQGSQLNSGNQAATADHSSQAAGKGSGSGTLRVQSTDSKGSVPAASTIHSDGQVSGDTSIEAQNAADSNVTDADTGSEQSGSDSSTSLQGGVGLTLGLSADGSASNENNSLFGL